MASVIVWFIIGVVVGCVIGSVYLWKAEGGAGHRVGGRPKTALVDFTSLAAIAQLAHVEASSIESFYIQMGAAARIDANGALHIRSHDVIVLHQALMEHIADLPSHNDR